MQEDRAKFWSSFFKDFYGEGMLSHRSAIEVLEWSRDVAMQASLKATLACAVAFSTTDFRSDLSAFRVPTLIIHGTKDKTVPIDVACAGSGHGHRPAALCWSMTAARMACSPPTSSASLTMCSTS